MTKARLQIALGAGVKADLLFTPHLYAYKGTAGVTLALPGDEVPEDERLRDTLSLYADVMYLAALNAWELDGHDGDCPYKRGDFHAWATEHPRDFGRAMAQCVEAMTGKTLAQTAQQQEQPEDGSKKKRSVRNGLGRRRSFLAK